MDKKNQYIAPKLTVVSFTLEHGYAASGLRLFQDHVLFEQDYDPSYNTQAQEKWEAVDNHFGSSW